MFAGSIEEALKSEVLVSESQTSLCLLMGRKEKMPPSQQQLGTNKWDGLRLFNPQNDAELQTTPKRDR